MLQETGTIKGTVKDANGQALSRSISTVAGIKTGTIADNNGNYTLAVTPGKHIFIVSFAGYATQRTEITVAGTGITDQNISLKMPVDLNNITVSAQETYPAQG